jgi:hypothetical protein
MKELLIEIALTLVSAVCTVLLTVGLPALVKWMRTQGIITSAEQEARLLELAPLAAAGVEEYARGAAKRGLRLESNEKLDQAARMARSLAIDGLKGVAEEKLRLAIEASLPKVRAELGQTAELPIFKVRVPGGEL